MDEDLRDAALSGNVEFLRKCAESNKPVHYYSTYFPKNNDDDGCHGNIFHMASDNNREEFIREAIQILPPENTQQLLLQPREPSNYNPLHEAAYVGNVEIVKMFLDVYRCLPTLPSDLSKRPWLQQNSKDHTPCYTAIASNHEECALELLKMDMELICNMPDISGSCVFYEAVLNKLTKLALVILDAPHSISCTGPKASNAFQAVHYLNYSEDAKEIFRRLLQREPSLIKKCDESGYSVFQYWVAYNKLWPFKCLLESHDIIPDVKRVFVNLVSSTDKYCINLLHNVAHYTPSEEVAIEIAKLLIDAYKQESSSISENVLPWLVQDSYGDTPFSLAISRQYEKLAMYILSVDEIAVIKIQKNFLFLAIEKECHEVVSKILEIIDYQGWTQLLYNDNKNVLHLAPLCDKDFCKQLIEGHPELLKGIDKGGITILHNWVKNGEVWLFKYILESKWRSTFVKLLDSVDYNNRNNPFHIAATITTNFEATKQIVKVLVEAYKEEFPLWKVNVFKRQPWFTKNKANQGPLHLAICNQCEELALYLLSLHEDHYINELLDNYKPEHTILFLAIQNNCRLVAEVVLSRLDKKSLTKYLTDSSDGRNILHLATSLKDEKFGTWLVNEAPEFITQIDNNGQSAWDKAYELGPAWFVKAVLEKDSSVFNSKPLAWINACENGHVQALHTFINHNPGAFRDLCIEYKDSPLHHIKLSTLTEYEEFLKIPRMKDLVNVQDSQGLTPLDKAIHNKDLLLTETLLSIDKIIYNIKDGAYVSAVDLLAQECNDNQAWDQMVKRIGLNPKKKITHSRAKEDVRNPLFVVAALVATITFTVGFTVPGGFNQDSGESLLAKKAAFLVFLISDTLAFFFSMLVLICLLLTMVYDSNRRYLFLIDRSMVLLLFAIKCTLLAFMTGVYTVIAPKTLWAAILVIIIMSSLIGISINKTLMFGIILFLDKLLLSSTM